MWNGSGRGKGPGGCRPPAPHVHLKPRRVHGVGRRPGHHTLSTGLQPRLKPLSRTKASGTPDDSANLSTVRCVQRPSPDCVHFSVTRVCPHGDPDSRGPCRSVTLAVGAWGPWQECVEGGSEGGWQLSGRSSSHGGPSSSCPQGVTGSHEQEGSWGKGCGDRRP